VALRNAENFREAGMEVESFGGVTVQLRSLPALLSDADPKALLLDLVDELVASVESRAGRTLTFEKFAGELAKVGARGERCRAESAQALLDQLFTCDLPYCTPDGRPTLVQYSSAELRRRFGKSH
jgi:DNA mismatch repair protein MutL